jgi:hypothetical protein
MRGIKKLNGTKKVEIDNWLKAQRTNNSTVLADNDVRRAVERMAFKKRPEIC